MYREYFLLCITLVLCQRSFSLSLERVVNEDEEIFWGHSPSLESAHYVYSQSKGWCDSHENEDKPMDQELRCIICDILLTPECASFLPGDEIDVQRGECVDRYYMFNPNVKNTPCNTYFNVFKFISSKSS